MNGNEKGLFIWGVITMTHIEGDSCAYYYLPAQWGMLVIHAANVCNLANYATERCNPQIISRRCNLV